MRFQILTKVNLSHALSYLALSGGLTSSFLKIRNVCSLFFSVDVEMMMRKIMRNSGQNAL